MKKDIEAIIIKHDREMKALRLENERKKKEILKAFKLNIKDVRL